MIIVDSHIGYGAPHKQDTSAAHGEPLGEDEVRLAKRAYGWPEDATFLVPDGVREHFEEGIGERGRRSAPRMDRTVRGYARNTPILPTRSGAHAEARTAAEGWDADLPTFPADAKGMASRDASGKVLNAMAARIPWLIGGSADLSPSTKT